MPNISFRFAVTRNGGEYGELRAVGAPSIRMTSSAQVKASFSGSFEPNPQVDFLTDHVRPFLTIDGVESSLGEYIISEASPRLENGVPTVALQGYDLGASVQRAALEERRSLPKGTRYTDAAQSFLLEAGISRVKCEDSELTLTVDRQDWEVGTSFLDIVNQLLGEINYSSLWFDPEGNARLEKSRAPSPEGLTFVYESGVHSIIKQDYSRTLDLFGRYNVFQAQVINPELGEPMVAVAVNNIPSSPTSVYRLGRIPAPIEYLDNIASQEALQEYVDGMRLRSMLETEKVSFETALEPGHGFLDVVALNIPGLQGVYQETGWEMSLSQEGQMTHEGRLVTYE